MILEDKNRTIKPPEGYWLAKVSVEGAYLRAEYHKNSLEVVGGLIGYQVVVIYANDIGREVWRTTDQVSLLPPEPPVPMVVVKPFWEVMIETFKKLFGGKSNG